MKNIASYIITGPSTTLEVPTQTDVIKKKVKLELRWHGIKRLPAADGFRTLPKADFYLDCRGIAEHGIKGTTGKAPEFQKGVREQSPSSLVAFEELIISSLKHIETRRAGSSDPYANPYVIVFLCAHGVHRSVASCHILAARLKARGYDVTINEGKLPTEAYALARNVQLNRPGAQE